MIDIFGWLGSTLFALCAVPQLLKVRRDGHARGMCWSFLCMWLFGAIFSIAYAINQPVIQIPPLMNYIATTAIVGLIVFVKVCDEYVSGDKKKFP